MLACIKTTTKSIDSGIGMCLSELFIMRERTLCAYFSRNYLTTYIHTITNTTYSKCPKKTRSFAFSNRLLHHAITIQKHFGKEMLLVDQRHIIIVLAVGYIYLIDHKRLRSFRGT